METAQVEPVQLRAVEPGDRATRVSELQRALVMIGSSERALGAGSVELPGVLANLPEGALILDVADGSVLAANEAARDLFLGSGVSGLRVDEALDAAFLHSGEALALERWPIARALQGETVSEVELTIRPPGGEQVPVLGSVSPIRGSRGQVVGILLTLRSIAHISEAIRLWEEFVSLIVHESRGALTAVLGCVGLLESLAQEPIRPRKTPGYVDPETQFLGMIKADVWQLNSMLSDLLDIARIGARDVKLEKQPVDLVGLIADLVDHLAPNTGTLVTGHRVRVSHRRLMPVVEADPARLEQVLTSVITTTARYSPPGTEISVVVESGPDEVTVSVSSKAGGIPKSQLDRLFDHYLRRQDLRQEYRGLGLSLHVARGLVEAHGGRIWAETRQGRGSAFRFTLPLR